MFKREHHVQIATILQALDADFLIKHNCLFGGGTAIVLSHGEYRESVDIDFLVSDIKGYQALRNTLTEKKIEAIARKGMKIESTTALRVDQYGIRTMLKVLDTEIKFEIIYETRIQLDKPSPKDQICGVATLTRTDMAVCKLLANSDRWSDDSVFNRDLIDLAMLKLPKKDLKIAIKKAEAPYGKSIQRDLEKAIQALSDRKGRLETCMSTLNIEQVPKALLWKYIKALKI